MFPFIFCNTKENYCAGKVRLHFEFWKSLSLDDFVLRNVKGVSVDCPNFVSVVPRPIVFNKFEKLAISDEIKRFLDLQIIEVSFHEPMQFISNIFYVPKRLGGVRIILNLKTFNKLFTIPHFKMNSIYDAIALMQRGCFFYKIDLHDAFYGFSIKKDHRKFFKFYWDDSLYQFTCLPMGFSLSPSIFSRLMHTLVTHVIEQGFSIIDYLDDFLGIQMDFYSAKEACSFLSSVLDRAGHTINIIKSILNPVQIIEFLGFVLNSLNMSVSLPTLRCEEIIAKCKRVLDSPGPWKIREIASLIGSFVACDPAVPLGP